MLPARRAQPAPRLNGAFKTLAVGQVLIFEETIGPLTGDPADADPTHRWAVRLTVATTTDHAGEPLTDPVNKEPLTSIAWAVRGRFAVPALPVLDHRRSPRLAASGRRFGRARQCLAADQGVWTFRRSLGAVPPAPIAPVAGHRLQLLARFRARCRSAAL